MRGGGGLKSLLNFFFPLMGIHKRETMAVRQQLVMAICVFGALCACGGSAHECPQREKRKGLLPVTISGLSSGAFMAVQAHVALSATIKGSAVLAGGPYFCARGDVFKATGKCLTGPISGSLVKELQAVTWASSKAGTIDDIKNLQDARIFVYSGQYDTIVHPEVVKGLVEYYEGFLAGCGEMRSEFNVPAEHCFPTLEEGIACKEFKSPYICACDYDGAGEALKTIYGVELKERAVQVPDEYIRSFRQGDFFGGDGMSSYFDTASNALSLAEEGYVFVPPDCNWENGKGKVACPIHIALHGCLQSSHLIGMDFVKKSGYNNWALSNNIIVVYPQTQATKFMDINPKACWDWWGYSTAYMPFYVTKDAPQITFIKNIIDGIQEGSITTDAVHE